MLAARVGSVVKRPAPRSGGNSDLVRLPGLLGRAAPPVSRLSQSDIRREGRGLPPTLPAISCRSNCLSTGFCVIAPLLDVVSILYTSSCFTGRPPAIALPNKAACSRPRTNRRRKPSTLTAVTPPQKVNLAAMGRPASFNPAHSTDIEKTMAPSTLDLFLLTFNCAKNLIDVGVFSTHLQAALSQNASGLPDLVALYVC